MGLRIQDAGFKGRDVRLTGLYGKSRSLAIARFLGPCWIQFYFCYNKTLMRIKDDHF